MSRAYNVTQVLADYVVNASFADLPPEVIHEAKRSLVNVLGVALGAANHPAVDMVLELAREAGRSEACTVWGRRERSDCYFAALANGIEAHLFDYDDTHPTILHPSAPVAPAAFALAELGGIDGRQLLTAFVLG
ncbi:MAG TPA: MmgE/PrpD family protein, partial [Bacillota bacterium]